MLHFFFFPSFLFSIQVRMIWECRTTGCQVPCHLWITTMVSPPLCRPERTLRNGRLSAHLAAELIVIIQGKWIPMDSHGYLSHTSQVIFRNVLSSLAAGSNGIAVPRCSWSSCLPPFRAVTEMEPWSCLFLALPPELVPRKPQETEPVGPKTSEIEWSGSVEMF